MSETNIEYVPPQPEDYVGFQPTPEVLPFPTPDTGSSPDTSTTPDTVVNGHLLKYKDEQGNWISLPVAIIDVYDTYVAHCVEKGITPVSQEDYYITLGNLSTLVQQLAGGSDAIQALAKALGNGALPPSMGGTGLSLSTAEYIYTLVTVEPEGWGTSALSCTNFYKLIGNTYAAISTWEDWKTDTFYTRTNSDYSVDTLDKYLIDVLHLITSSDVDYKISLLNQELSNTKLSVDRIIIDPATPNNSVGKDGDFYFQIKN